MTDTWQALLSIGLLFTLVLYVRYKPLVSKSGHYLIISYLVRDELEEARYREFIVFNLKEFKFVKSSM